MQEWQIDLSEIKSLRRWYKKQPNIFRKAQTIMLNNFAFGTKAEAFKQIGRTMTIRNPGFVSGRIRVTQATMDNLRAITGSVAKERFTGWTEQELGTNTPRNRFATMAARSGDFSKQVKPSVRLKPGMKAVTIQDYHPRGGDANFGGFLAMLYRRKERGLVKIGRGFFKLPSSLRPLPGPTQSGRPLYKDMMLMQLLKKKQPKRNHWLLTGRANYFRKTDIPALWRTTLNRLLTPPPKR